eukprot:TRINITY_DN160_c2_g2_i1.p1 TRINITY_DN160_c2_g2~~TRINITY_DN160_c2_g2_i1.p1  ORF type:complete len:624 (+),score=92.93 TRINITY_DN160_c2_g2_i1:200-2071(+)
MNTRSMTIEMKNDAVVEEIVHLVPNSIDPILIYPESATVESSMKKRCSPVTLTNADLLLFNTQDMLNDNCIEAYFRHLQLEVFKDLNSKVFIFNTFFYKKFSEACGNGKDGDRVRKAYSSVEKWVKNDLFSFDYLIIPVNMNTHWSVTIVCNPGALNPDRPYNPTQNQNSVASAFFGKAFRKPKEEIYPCFIHMDSSPGCHIRTYLNTHIKLYLEQEWKAKKRCEPNNVYEVFPSAQTKKIDSPKQENGSDCGVFVLMYVEKFMEFISKNNITMKLFEKEKMKCFGPKWFSQFDVTCKRSEIATLLAHLSKIWKKNREKNRICEQQEVLVNDVDTDADDVEVVMVMSPSPKKRKKSSKIVSLDSKDNECEEKAGSVSQESCDSFRDKDFVENAVTEMPVPLIPISDPISRPKPRKKKKKLLKKRKRKTVVAGMSDELKNPSQVPVNDEIDIFVDLAKVHSVDFSRNSHTISPPTTRKRTRISLRSHANSNPNNLQDLSLPVPSMNNNQRTNYVEAHTSVSCFTTETQKQLEQKSREQTLAMSSNSHFPNPYGTSTSIGLTKNPVRIFAGSTLSCGRIVMGTSPSKQSNDLPNTSHQVRMAGKICPLRKRLQRGKLTVPSSTSH